MTKQAVSLRTHLSRPKERGVALLLVLGALTILTVMLTEFQDETSAELASALSARDAIKAEYAAQSAVNLSRLLIASEPTIRKALAPIFLMMKRGPPQIPVWAFADRVLGAFNDEVGTAAFSSLASVNLREGKNLGLPGAGFEVKIVDEDSKINANTAARGDAFSQVRLATQLLALFSGPQYDALFDNRDADGQFSDRQTICSAIVDWTDPDQDAYVCDTRSGTAQQSAAEDSFYQLLKTPYARKNAAFDSLQELHMVRGVSDDFWATFVEPDPENPSDRVLTVWGQGAVNVNTANPQTLLAVICAYAVPGTPLCNDANELAKFASVFSVVQQFTMGAPLFSSPKAFKAALQGKGMFGELANALEMQPVQFVSEDQLLKSITTESKVFSIYATGYVKAGKRETRVRVHSVVDFRGAPPPGQERAGQLNALLGQQQGTAGSSGQQGTGGSAGQQAGAGGSSGLPEGAGAEAIASAFQASAAGNVVYYRIY